MKRDNVSDALNTAGRSVMDFLFPRRCPFCGGVTGRALLCKVCEASLPYCAEVRTDASIGRCTAPLYYEESVRRAILAFKFNGKMGSLECFGQLMAQCAAERYCGEFDAVTWVPVSKKRLRRRGYDQSRLLAGSLCVDYHVAPVETLEKVTDNPAQSSLEGAAARRANVLGVYRALSPERIAGKRWLLVDDILTTGATLRECVRVLRDAGAAEVICLTLAMVREKQE